MLDKNQYLYFENDTVKIKYSFWNNNGVIAYTFTNKLNKPLYIDWKKSAFVKNGNKLDYWEDKTVFNGSFLYLGDYNLLNYSEWGRVKINIIKPERITFLAPKSTITRVWNSIYPFPTNKIKKDKNNKYTLKQNASNKNTSVLIKHLTPENTNISFRNFMTISTTEKFEQESYIDNQFYNSIIYQMKMPDFYELPFMKPTWFYVILK